MNLGLVAAQCNDIAACAYPLKTYLQYSKRSVVHIKISLYLSFGQTDPVSGSASGRLVKRPFLFLLEKMGSYTLFGLIV